MATEMQPGEVNALDPYTYKGTSTLVNLRGIKNPDVLAVVEADAVSSRSREIPPELRRGGNMDLAQLRGLHKHLFQDVYAWAGELRTVNISKGTSSFARTEYLAAYGDGIFNKLAKDNHLKGLEKPEFVDRLAGYYADVNALHPFREGNGRSTRAFFQILSEQAGYKLDYRKIDKQEWNEAAARSMRGDLAPITEIFSKAVRPERAIAFEQMERTSAIAKHPELANAYAMFDAIVRKIKVEYPNNRLAQEKFSTQARDSIGLQLNTGRVPGQQRQEPKLTPLPADRTPLRGSTRLR